MTSPKLTVPKKGPRSNALTPYSLLGSATELEKRAIKQKPLLGAMCLTGEAAVWYGKYGTGKTLFALHFTIEAIQDRRIDAANVYYINADDSSAGLAEKLGLMEDFGVHVLAPGHRGFRTNLLAELLEHMTASGTADGTFLIFDTLKKFVDIMDKRATRAFNDVIRQFVMNGGTVLALAHTNKRPDSNGKPVPEGTGDVLNDFDCGYLLDRWGESETPGEIVVEFGRVKSRGPAVLKAYYAYDPDPNLRYDERLSTIREIDPADARYANRPMDVFDESGVVENIILCLQHNSVTKMDIVRTAGMASGVSRRAVLAVLERYTGKDPEIHRWNYTVREHGRMVYAPIDPPPKQV